MESLGGTAPLPPPQPSQPYMQLALYLAGNTLTVVIGLLIWNLNTVLADFRDSMLYALLCSIALRPVKDWLVAHMDRSLSDPRRSVGGALLSLLALPLTALVDAYEEGRAILAKWRQVAQEELQRRQAQLKRSSADAAAAAAAATPSSPHTPRTAAAVAATAAQQEQQQAAAMQTMPSLAVYGHAAVKVLKSRRTSKKRRKQRQLLRQRAPEGSSILFRWLFRVLAAWLLWEWVRDSWSATVQLVLIVGTAVLALGVVPLLLLLTTNHYLGSAFSPVKTPTASATQNTADNRKRLRHLRSVSPPNRPCFSPFANGGRRGRAGSPADTSKAEGGASGGPATATARLWEWCCCAWQATRAACRSILSSLESALRSSLRSNLHALVTILLILGLFIGTTGLAAFLSVRVAQEGRATVLAVRDVFPAAWAGMAASTPLLADAVAGDSSSGGGRQRPAVVLPDWVASYQKEALQLVQQALPAVASWAESQLYGFVEKQNLTSALGDIRLLYGKLQGPRPCSEREREKLVVALAKAEVALQAARDTKQQAAVQLKQCRESLRQALAGLEEARRSSGAPQPAPAPEGCGALVAAAAGDDGGGECVPGEQEEAPPLNEHVLQLEAQVVAADEALTAAKAANKAAAVQRDAAEREQRAALSHLQLCSTEQQAGQPASLLPGLAGEVGAGLQQAYAKFWRRQFREGARDMRQAARHCVSALRGVVQRGSDAVADLSSLQRLVQAAADPLMAAFRVLGRLFAGSVGSTTAAAVMGGLGVLRLGMGVVKFGMQLMLFLALLYYLLAAQADPLLAAVGVLPLSEPGRQRAAVALNRALGGVLVSSMKLITFHGCFSWITFRIMALPLTYTASVASAVCALLPFVPTYAVALPGCVVLLAQGRLLAALAFFALHFMGYYIGDTMILEDIPGGHPYMLSLGILGGIYAFENPLQGCLLGPILLSLLSVFYNLHSEFMGGGGSSSTTAPDGRPLHRLWSITPATGGRAKQQHLHVRMSGTPTAAAREAAADAAEVAAAELQPELGTGLRVNVRTWAADRTPSLSPQQRTSGEDMGEHNLLLGGQQAQQQAQQRRLQQTQQRQSSGGQSVSLSLGRSPLSAAPEAVYHLGRHEEGEEDGEGEQQEEEGKEGEGDSHSVGNSFSFGTPLLDTATSASGKLHDD